MHLCCEVVFQTFLSVLVHACDLHSQGPLSTGAWWPEDLLFISGACCSGWGQHLTWVGIYSWFFSGGAEEGWRCWSGGGEAAKPQQSKQGCISRAARKCLATVCSAHHRCCRVRIFCSCGLLCHRAELLQLPAAAWRPRWIPQAHLYRLCFCCVMQQQDILGGDASSWHDVGAEWWNKDSSPYELHVSWTSVLSESQAVTPPAQINSLECSFHTNSFI